MHEVSLDPSCLAEGQRSVWNNTLDMCFSFLFITVVSFCLQNNISPLFKSQITSFIAEASGNWEKSERLYYVNGCVERDKKLISYLHCLCLLIWFSYWLECNSSKVQTCSCSCLHVDKYQARLISVICWFGSKREYIKFWVMSRNIHLKLSTASFIRCCSLTCWFVTSQFDQSPNVANQTPGTPDSCYQALLSWSNSAFTSVLTVINGKPNDTYNLLPIWQAI